MMPHCLAHGCRNCCDTSDPSVTFHAFPDCVEAARRWAGLCEVSEADRNHLIQDVEQGHSAKYHICSLHFADSDFEESLSSPNREAPGGAKRKLRYGAQPSVFLTAPIRPNDECSENGEQVPVAHPDLHFKSKTESGKECSCPLHCVTQTMVRSSHQNMDQIVLNFLEQNKKLIGDNVSVQCAAQCSGSCNITQGMVKQVVIILMEPPKHTPPSTSQEPSHSVTTSTQTERTRGPEDVPHLAKHSPPKLCQEPQHTVSTSTQTELSMEYLQKHLRNPKEEAASSSYFPQRPHFCQKHAQCDPCFLTPSINQYVDSLLAQHKVPLQESSHSCCISASTSQCSCHQSTPFVKQIIINFLEQGNNPVKLDVPTQQTSRDQSPPADSRQQHMETQTHEEHLQINLRNPRDLSEHPPSDSEAPTEYPPSPPSATTILAGSLKPEDGMEPLSLKIHECPSEFESQCNYELHRDLVTFEDIAVYFSKDEWQLLGDEEKELYKDVMMENYHNLRSLGYSKEKPDLIVCIENEQLDLWKNSDRDCKDRQAEREEEHWCPLDMDVEAIHCLDRKDTQKPQRTADRASAEGSSHLGALMRLVNEIPGFLLGSSVTDGSMSPAGSLEEHENLGPISEIKTEESSPACTPVSLHVPHLRETPDIYSVNRRMVKNIEPVLIKSVTKTEESKTEVAIGAAAKHEDSFSPSHPSSCNKTRPACDLIAKSEFDEEECSIKQERSPTCTPVHGFLGPKTIPDLTHRAPHALKKLSHGLCSQGDHTPEAVIRTINCKGSPSTWLRAPPDHALRTSPGNQSISPECGISGGILNIKQEDSGSEDNLPVCLSDVRKLSAPPADPLQQSRGHRRPEAPRRSLADSIPPGNSHLHGLMNCLKEISACQPRPYSNTITSARWGSELGRICAETTIRSGGSVVTRTSEISPVPPNPFTVAVTNGVSRMPYAQQRTPETWSPQPGRDGKFLDKVAMRVHGLHGLGRSGPQMVEEMRRPVLGVKRTHSEDMVPPSGSMDSKRPVLEPSSPSHPISNSFPGQYDLWRPPEDLRGPSEANPTGKSHLVNVVNCVKKIPHCRPSPPVKGPRSAQDLTTTECDLSQTHSQGIIMDNKTKVHVKEEKCPSPALAVPGQWVQPPSSPRDTEGHGPSFPNMHLIGLMKLMEDIPRPDSGSSSRAMFSIAVGRTEIRRAERTGHFPLPADDTIFQPESNDTIASVDSVFSDDISVSSENVDPSYSAIDGLQKVVSEFAELGSVSPLVAVAAPPVSVEVAEESGVRKSKESAPGPPCSTRLNEKGREPLRSTLVNAGSRCSAEDGKASYAALCGLEKVVHGFSEQECVSPFAAIRIQSSSNLPEITANKHSDHEDTDSSYSALSGLQKVVNGFSEVGCVSPFSAVSTTASEPAMETSVRKRTEPPVLADTSNGHNAVENFHKSSFSFLTDEDWPVSGADSSYSALTGLQKVVNGVPDIGCLSPLTVVSIPSSEGDQEPSVKRRCERNNEDVWQMSPQPLTEKQSQPCLTAGAKADAGLGCGSNSPRRNPSARSQCIDLTEEEESICINTTPSTLNRHQKPLSLGMNSTLSASERPQKPTWRHTMLPSVDKYQKPISGGTTTTTSVVECQQRPIPRVTCSTSFTPDRQQKPISREVSVTSFTSDTQQKPISREGNAIFSTPDRQQIPISRDGSATSSAPERQQRPISRESSTTSYTQHGQEKPISREGNATSSTLYRQQRPISREGGTLSYTLDRQQRPISREGTATSSTLDKHQRPISREGSATFSTMDKHQRPISREGSATSSTMDRQQRPISSEGSATSSTMDRQQRPISREGTATFSTMDKHQRHISREGSATSSTMDRQQRPISREGSATSCTPDRQQRPISREGGAMSYTPDRQQRPISREGSATSCTPDRQQRPISREGGAMSYTPDRQQRPISREGGARSCTPDRQQRPISREGGAMSYTPDRQQRPISREGRATTSTMDRQQRPISSEGRATSSTMDRHQRPISREGSATSSTRERQQRPISREATSPSTFQVTSSQCIDLTTEEHLAKSKDLTPELGRGVASNDASHRKPSDVEKRQRLYIDLTRDSRRNLDKHLHPGPSGQETNLRKGGVTTVNEHLSGLEKLLKDMSSLASTNHPSEYSQSATWWFKSTTPPET
ncbi:uncharacterized protein LOC134609502 [Pelobates fuscus]|uniref:uncharacterized protein LOC134609502 n=1 Tax=Pelobates fuscus TaxID=191477 RepID=UPI002FE4EDDA